MKRFILLLILLYSFQFSKAQSNAEIKNVNQTIVQFFDGFSTLDINTVKKYSTPDFLLLEDAVVWNIDTIANRFERTKSSGASFKRMNSFEFIRTEIKGNTAWVAYQNTADISLGDRKRTVKWLESAVIVKQRKGWKIQMMHSTPVKEKID